MSPFLGNNGYLHVAPKFGPARKKLLVHRLVAQAFVPGQFAGACVNHIDGDKTNNIPANLEWTTLAENTRHQWATGLVDLRGENHPRSKLRNEDVPVIRQSLRNGIPIKQIAATYSVSEALIYKIRSGHKKAFLA